MLSRILAAASLTLLAAGCAQPADAPGNDGATEAQEPISLVARLSEEQRAGMAIYETVCWTCHGQAGRGDGPAVLAGSTGAPPSFLLGGYAEISAAELENRFRAAFEGADDAHPHMQYVVNLLRPERFRAALSFIPALAYPADLPGSALAGLALYEERCVNCHGENGDGAGYAADFLELAKPADFTSDTLIATRNFEGLFQRIREGGQEVHGSSMPAWGLALDDDQLWDLVAYVATFQPGVLPPLPTR